MKYIKDREVTKAMMLKEYFFKTILDDYETACSMQEQDGRFIVILRQVLRFIANIQDIILLHYIPGTIK